MKDERLTELRDEADRAEKHSRGGVQDLYDLNLHLIKTLRKEREAYQAARAVCEWVKDIIEDRPELQFDELSGVQELLKAYDAEEESL